MFDKKSPENSQEVKAPAGDVLVHTIPDVFYGGKDPDIYHTKEMARPVSSTQTISGTVVETKKHKWLWIVLIAFGFLVLVGLVSWYYLRGFYQQSPAPAVISKNTNTVVVPIVETAPVEPAPVAPTTTPVVPSAPIPETLINVSFPSAFLPDSADLDGDSLTDAEEEIFATDSGISDTDGDGYYDGQEIENLYSPTGIAPEKLINQTTVAEYVHPNFGYRFYYPRAWQVSAVDPEGVQTLISSPSGEYVEIIQFDKQSGERFVDWYARVIGTSARFSDFISTQNRFKFDVFRRNDWLSGFVEHNQFVYVIVYHSANATEIKFRRTMVMLLQSFRPIAGAPDIPAQEIISTNSTDIATTSVDSAGLIN